MSAIRPALVVDPPRALVDEVVTVRVEGCVPHTLVELDARTHDEQGLAWTSSAVFESDAHGTVDLTTRAPREGSWSEASAMGFVWSMAQDPSEPPQRYHQTDLRPATVSLEASTEGTVLARAELERVFVAPGVTRSDIRTDGLVGTLYEPASRSGEGRAAVLVLGGSLGGLENARAAALASRGHPALALAYFGIDPLPDELVGVELEYFDTAIRFLIDRGLARPGRLALMGTSRGGELVLLLASRSRDVGGVIAYVPSGVVHYGIPTGGDRRRIEVSDDPDQRPPAWVVSGRGIPGAPVRFDLIDFGDRPVRFCPAFRGGLADEKAIESARIALDDVTVPVILFSTADDQVWPSPALADLAVERLTSSTSVEHIVYEDAGHNIGHPYMPTSTRSYIHPLNGLDMALGGTDAGDAFANQDSWERALALLARI